MKKNLCITVVGKSGAAYCFEFQGEEKWVSEWVADGLDIDEVVNTIPAWVALSGLTRPWCWLQDRWQWLRLF